MSNNIMANSSIFANTGTDDATAAKTDRVATDKHTFLKLLVAQLSNQDPLNPTEDKEFVAQLAQFTSLEQLQEINAGVGTLNTTMTQGQMLSATSFIGKDIVASGNQITKLNDSEGNILTTRVYYTVDEDITKAQATIYDSSGNLVQQLDISGRQAGTHEFIWDGKGLTGKEALTGVYTIYISAQNKNDKAVIVKQQFTARVTGVMNEDGVYKLTLDGGRSVPLTDVTEVTNATETITSSTAANSYATAAADGAAAAQLGAEAAAAALDEAAAATTADAAKKASDKAASAAKSARKGATTAKDAADAARELAEEVKTAESLKSAEAAKASAEQAEAYAQAAEQAAADAKAIADAFS